MCNNKVEPQVPKIGAVRLREEGKFGSAEQAGMVVIFRRTMDGSGGPGRSQRPALLSGSRPSSTSNSRNAP